MFTKGNKVYADTYKYLRRKNVNSVSLSSIGNEEDFDELAMELPIKVEVVGNNLFWQNRLFLTSPKSLNYSEVKEHIVRSRYSYDEQIAIMLNKDKSSEDSILYDRMQEWRDFAAEIARIVDVDGYNATSEIEIVRDKVLDNIVHYDSSSEVNEFTVQGVKMWLDKATRSGLKLRFESEKTLGKTDTTLWYGETMFNLNIDMAMNMLYRVEVYASECYDNTQKHLTAVKKITDVDELKSYAYKSGYPEKLAF